MVVAEDSTAYGLDIDRKRRIHELLAALADVDGVGWVRLMYAYPHTVLPDLTAVIREFDPTHLVHLGIYEPHGKEAWQERGGFPAWESENELFEADYDPVADQMQPTLEAVTYDGLRPGEFMKKWLLLGPIEANGKAKYRSQQRL